MDNMKVRFKELYPTLYQCKKLCKNGYVIDNFVKVVLLEVCHKNRINWAYFASKRWTQKTSCYNEGDLIISYNEENMINSNYVTIENALKRETNKKIQ